MGLNYEKWQQRLLAEDSLSWILLQGLEASALVGGCREGYSARRKYSTSSARRRRRIPRRSPVTTRPRPANISVAHMIFRSVVLLLPQAWAYRTHLSPTPEEAAAVCHTPREANSLPRGRNSTRQHLSCTECREQRAIRVTSTRQACV